MQKKREVSMNYYEVTFPCRISKGKYVTLDGRGPVTDHLYKRQIEKMSDLTKEEQRWILHDYTDKVQTFNAVHALISVLPKPID